MRAAPSMRRTDAVGRHRHADRFADHAADRSSPCACDARIGVVLDRLRCCRRRSCPSGVDDVQRTASMDLPQRRGAVRRRPRRRSASAVCEASARTSPGRPWSAGRRCSTVCMTVRYVACDVPLLPADSGAAPPARTPARRTRQTPAGAQRRNEASNEVHVRLLWNEIVIIKILHRTSTPPDRRRLSVTRSCEHGRAEQDRDQRLDQRHRQQRGRRHAFEQPVVEPGRGDRAGQRQVQQAPDRHRRPVHARAGCRRAWSRTPASVRPRRASGRR